MIINLTQFESINYLGRIRISFFNLIPFQRIAPINICDSGINASPICCMADVICTIGDIESIKKNFNGFINPTIQPKIEKYIIGLVNNNSIFLNDI